MTIPGVGLLRFWFCLLLGVLVAVSAQAEEGVSRPAEAWMEAGWAALERDGLEAAIEVWQEGVNRLPPDRLLLSPVGFFPDRAGALRGVRRLGLEFRGLVLRGNYRGEPNYFVLAAPAPGELEMERAHLGQLVYGGKGRILGWSAARFQPGGDLAASGARYPSSRGDAASFAGRSGSAGAPAKRPVARATVHARSTTRRMRATPEQESRMLMGMARQARKQGNRKQAIALLREVLKRTPDHARARLMSGQLLVRDGQYDAAWQVMKPLLKEDALDWKPWFWSGTAELMAGRLDAAAKHLDEALARDGRIVAVWVQRALVAQQKGHYAVAYQLLKVAEAQAPKSVQVMLNIGYTLDALGERDAAVAYYRRFLVKTAGDARRWRARKAVLERLAQLSR